MTERSTKTLCCLGFLFAISATSFAESAELSSAVKGLQLKLDHIWVLTAAALVFLMQAGFMCLESGLSRQKNSINVAVKNLADLVIAVAGLWLVGFGLMFGMTAFGIWGTTDFVIAASEDSWRSTFFVFQVVFCGTAATIVSGAVAERTRFAAYLLISLFVSAAIYPLFGHWAWGSLLHEGNTGWLEEKGFMDFAGSTVVHSVGGWIALAAIIVIGPRIGKFDEEGKPTKLQAHNLPMAFLGVLILFFGWFGFNCGSTLSADDLIASIALNTMLAACFGGISCTAVSWLMNEEKIPEAEMMANGVLGGLVGVTAGCAFVETSGAVVIGLVAGILVCGGTYILENILKLDDVVGAIPVHGVCGAWGTLAVALFITEQNLPEGMNRMDLFGIQLLGVMTCFIWTFGSTCLILHIVNIIVPLRVPPDDEKMGLNVAEHGAVSSVLDLAYSMQDVTKKGSYSMTNQVAVEYGTEIGDLAQCFNQMIETVQQQRNLAAAEMNDYRGHMDDSVQLIADVIGNMVQSLGETGNKAVAMSESFQRATQTIEGLAGSLRDISSNTQQASQIAEAAAEGAEKSRGIVDVLGRSTVEIDQIISTITEIADQTQILSLNATIEAVHAGEAGRGFSVVANEVKTLAKQSSRAADEISGRIKQIKEKMNETVSVIQHISEVIGQMNQINYDIAETVTEQARGAAQINELVHDTGLTVQEVLEYIQRVSQGADEISKQVNDSHEQFQQLMDKSEFAA